MIPARRFWIAAFVWLFVAAMAAAQTPALIAVQRFRGYNQVSATEKQPAVSGFILEVDFASAVETTTSVQLRGPNGAVTNAVRTSAARYFFQQQFPDDASLRAAFPDGDYAVMVGGGGQLSQTAVDVHFDGSPALEPVLISNYDALQAIHPVQFAINWPSIPGASSGDRLTLTIRDRIGTLVFTAPSNFAPTASTLAAAINTAGDVLTGELDYAKVTTSSANSGATQIIHAVGFALRFPLKWVGDPPTIASQPRSVITQIGHEVRFLVDAIGGTSYEWRKDGVVVQQGISKELILPVKATDAGNYTVDVINSTGRVTSQPATLAIVPSLTLTTFAGHPDLHGAIDGPLDQARFSRLLNIAVDAAGTVFVLDGNAVRKVANGIVTTFAGGIDLAGFRDGSGTTALFFNPQALAIDQAGNLFVSDGGNRRIRKITPDGIVSTLPAPLAPIALAVGPGGNLYGCSGYDVVRISPTGEIATLYTRADARTVNSAPKVVALDRAGNLFVGDRNTGEIVKITPDGKAALYAGGYASKGPSPLGGVGTTVSLQGLNSLGVDPAGNLFVGTDGGYFTIITPSLVVTRASTPPGLSDGHIAVDGAGAVYSVNNFNADVRKGMVTWYSTDPGVAITAPPQPQTIASGDAVAFSVAAAGTELSFQWLKNGAVIPDANDPVLVVHRTAESADYSVIVGNPIGAVVSPVVRATIASSPTPGRIVNYSLRARAGVDAESLIMGCVVGGGSSGSTRTMLVRGVGPGLEAYGVTNVLARPVLTVADGNGVAVGSNDGWNGDPLLAAAGRAVGAFPLAPQSKDAALLLRLGPGAYTAQVAGANATTGVALAEVYDSSGSFAATDSRLINVSARSTAGTGNDTLTVGFVVVGTTAKTVLVRGIGPSLLYFGVAGFMRNPKIDLFANDGTRIAGNDDWSGATLSEVFKSVGAFSLPDPSLDAALAITLRPGAYTVQVSAAATNSSGGATDSGVALIEIYEIP